MRRRRAALPQSSGARKRSDRPRAPAPVLGSSTAAIHRRFPHDAINSIDRCRALQALLWRAELKDHAEEAAPENRCRAPRLAAEFADPISDGAEHDRDVAAQVPDLDAINPHANRVRVVGLLLAPVGRLVIGSVHWRHEWRPRDRSRWIAAATRAGPLRLTRPCLNQRASETAGAVFGRLVQSCGSAAKPDRRLWRSPCPSGAGEVISGPARAAGE
jgi:hypothetical protein